MRRPVPVIVSCGFCACTVTLHCITALPCSEGRPALGIDCSHEGNVAMLVLKSAAQRSPGQLQPLHCHIKPGRKLPESWPGAGYPGRFALAHTRAWSRAAQLTRAAQKRPKNIGRLPNNHPEDSYLPVKGRPSTWPCAHQMVAQIWLADSCILPGNNTR